MKNHIVKYILIKSKRSEVFLSMGYLSIAKTTVFATMSRRDRKVKTQPLIILLITLGAILSSYFFLIEELNWRIATPLLVNIQTWSQFELELFILFLKSFFI